MTNRPSINKSSRSKTLGKKSGNPVLEQRGNAPTAVTDELGTANLTTASRKAQNEPTPSRRAHERGKAKGFLERDISGYEQFAKENGWAWSERKKRNLPYSMDVYDFLREFYTPWILRGLTRADIKTHDSSLWWAIQNRLRDGKPMPDDVYIPKEAQVALDQAASVEERLKIEGRREYFRSAQADYQSKLRKQHDPQP